MQALAYIKIANSLSEFLKFFRYINYWANSPNPSHVFTIWRDLSNHSIDFFKDPTIPIKKLFFTLENQEIDHVKFPPRGYCYGKCK